MSGNGNANKSKFNNFIVQGGILALAGVLVRILGLAKRIPLTYIIGDVGNSYYSAAYEIYNIVLTVSSYGIPLSVSKLVAARVNKGQYKNADKIFKCTLLFAIVVGFLASSLVFIFAAPLSNMMHEPMSYLALRVLSPTLFVVAIMGVFRGFFQGQGTMVPTAFSQLIEQIILIAVSLTSAYMLSKKGSLVGDFLKNPNYKNAYGAAGATLGCSVGALASLAFLIFIYRKSNSSFKRKVLRDPSDRIESTGYVYKTLILTIVPVVISSTVNNVSNFLDQYIHNRIMVEKGLESIKSVNWGIYSGKYLVLIGVPIAMANAMGASSVPTLAGIMRRKAYDEAREKIGRVIKITMMISIPCAMGMAVLAPEVMHLLFSTTDMTAPTLLRIGALGIVLFSFSTLTNGILQGMSKLSKPIIHGLIALAVHVTLLVVLLKFTELNIYAVAFSNNIFSLVICILNVFSIKRTVGYRQEVLKTFVYPLISSVIMGLVIIGLKFLLSRSGLSRPVTLLEILVGIIVYFVAMIVSKGITENDLMAVPGGSKLYAVLNRLHLM
ncbi:MAG: polysaccharide biosynthesis protein [Lachnospiraceae bacterium]|nr:polysaccharide biosynthesis protein [Lachnospiraceae bacterium]